MRFRTRIAMAGAAFALGGVLCALPVAAQPSLKPISKASAPTVAPARFAYDLKNGSSQRYRVTALLHGQFPPFIEPVTVELKFDYLATVKKQEEKGMQVEFVVDTADLWLLAKEPKPGETLSEDDRTPFPIPLSQIQSALNVTATLKPDGSIVTLAGGDSNSTRINLGLELRKLFLLVMPVVFPERPLKPNDTWRFDDGILGKNPGKISYQGKLVRNPEPQQPGFVFQQEGVSRIDEKKDKSDKVTEKPEEVVDTTTGNVAFNATLTFAPTATNAGTRLGRLMTGQMQLKAKLERKRTIPDPNRPDDPLQSTIDLRGRLAVQAIAPEPKTKPTKSSAAQKRAGNAKSKP